MTVQSVPQAAQAQTPAPQVEQKQTDKEMNFRMLEQKYQKQLEQERAARLDAERQLQEKSKRQEPEEEDDDNEPYVDRKKLKKEQAKFGQQMRQETKSEIQQAVQMALEQERQKNWVKANPDFQETMQHAEDLYKRDPELAETILEMPEGFERTKLVYKSIKALGLHKPPVKDTTIQDKIDANRRTPYYQPTAPGSPPSLMGGDFSAQGQKNAYNKMQELKARLNIQV